ncbi:hypothetical protein B0H16DRAFT_1688911 [Mycena metata]|uniref:Uncharacterized protein n=1 Tax=Mycena metata TaxID=1033252 RepID=A0AAD7NH28_9AGAR|nr:hypothetical protein B0H16DRAFT_1688911 [Mycena metata]
MSLKSTFSKTAPRRNHSVHRFLLLGDCRGPGGALCAGPFDPKFQSVSQIGLPAAGEKKTRSLGEVELSCTRLCCLNEHRVYEAARSATRSMTGEGARTGRRRSNCIFRRIAKDAPVARAGAGRGSCENDTEDRGWEWRTMDRNGEHGRRKAQKMEREARREREKVKDGAEAGTRRIHATVYFMPFLLFTNPTLTSIRREPVTRWPGQEVRRSQYRVDGAASQPRRRFVSGVSAPTWRDRSRKRWRPKTGRWSAWEGGG